MWLSFVHSIKMCLIEYWFPHGHFGGGFSFRMSEWVSWVCSMRSRVRVVSSLLVLLGSSFLSFKIGCIWKSLLRGFSSHNCFGNYLFDFRFEVSIWSFNGVVANEKVAFGSPSTTVANFTYFNKIEFDSEIIPNIFGVGIKCKQIQPKFKHR